MKELFLPENPFYPSLSLGKIPNILCLVGPNSIGKSTLLFRINDVLEKGKVLCLENDDELLSSFLWKQVQKQKEEQAVLGLLQIFAPGIQAIRYPFAKTGDGFYHLFQQFGSGSKRMLTFALEVFDPFCTCLLVDCLEQSLHYGTYEPFWKWVFQTFARKKKSLIFSSYSDEFLFRFVLVGEQGEQSYGIMELKQTYGNLHARLIDNQEAVQRASTGIGFFL